MASIAKELEEKKKKDEEKEQVSCLLITLLRMINLKITIHRSLFVPRKHENEISLVDGEPTNIHPVFSGRHSVCTHDGGRQVMCIYVVSSPCVLGSQETREGEEETFRRRSTETRRR